MRKATSLIISLLIPCASLAGELAVEIVDAPSTVWSYSPVLVTAEVTNHGSEGLLVALNDCCRANRVLVETGLEGEQLEARERFTGTQLTDAPVVWLEPGARWLVRADITPWLVDPGHYQVRVGVVGSGQCVIAPQLRSRIPAEPREKRFDGSFLYDCWAGTVYSQTVAIASEAPPGEVNRAALEWLHSDKYPGPRVGRPFLQLSLAYRWLKERFPGSHYTYVAGLYGNTGSNSMEREALEELLRLQPDHPLTAETRLRLALGKLKSGSPPLAEDIANLPQPLVAYLDQEVKQQRAEGKKSCQHLPGN